MPFYLCFRFESSSYVFSIARRNLIVPRSSLFEAPSYTSRIAASLDASRGVAEFELRFMCKLIARWSVDS